MRLRSANVRQGRENHMNCRITLGGRISIALALFWAVSVSFFLSRVPSSGHLEDVVVWITLPLGVIGGTGSIFARRGVMELNEVFYAYILMIPNVFLLGYGIAGCCRLSVRMADRTRLPDSGASPTAKIPEVNEAGHSNLH